MEQTKNWFGWQIAAKNNFYTGNESALYLLVSGCKIIVIDGVNPDAVLVQSIKYSRSKTSVLLKLVD